MSLPQDCSAESSGYSTSASSSDFGSLDEYFKFPSAPFKRDAKKRRAEENVEDLDEMMKEQLTLSPEKRIRLNSTGSYGHSEEDDPERGDGRPPTRRSSSSDVSPRVQSMRAACSGNSIDIVRTMSAVSSDSISPKLLKHLTSPKRSEFGSVYSKHRLGATFSPLIAGAKRKLATPSHRFTPHGERIAAESPRLSGLRKNGAIRLNRPSLCDRLKD